MFDSSKYEKLLSDFILKAATYSYNKKLSEYNLDSDNENTLRELKNTALELRTEIGNLPKGAQSRLLLEKIEKILETGN
jgi:hypothetical protein